MRKFFEEPVIEVNEFVIEDIVTASGDDWSGGDF